MGKGNWEHSIKGNIESKISSGWHRLTFLESLSKWIASPIQESKRNIASSITEENMR